MNTELKAVMKVFRVCFQIAGKWNAQSIHALNAYSAFLQVPQGAALIVVEPQRFAVIDNYPHGLTATAPLN